MRKVRNKIYALLFTAVVASASVNHANAEAPAVIKPGNWSLGDAFEIKYEKDNSKSYSYRELQELYEKKFVDEDVNEYSLNYNELLYQQYILQYNSICDSITKYKELANQYKAFAKTYEDEMNSSIGTQRDTAQQNMQQSLLMAQSYEVELTSAVSQKAEIYANRENSLFLKNNSAMLSNQQYISQTADYRNSIYELMLLYKKYELQSSFAEYYKLKADAQSINQRNDLSFKTDVDLYNADYFYYLNQKDMFKQQFNTQFELLLERSGIPSTQGVLIKTDIKDIRSRSLISLNTFENNCYSNDIKKRQLEDKLRIIDDKISILKEYYSEASNEVRLAQNEKAQLSLQLSNWLIQRKNNVKKVYSAYTSTHSKINIMELKTKSLYERYIILLNKYNYGITDLLSVKEAELNYAQSSLEAWNALFEFTNSLGTVEKFMSGNMQ